MVARVTGLPVLALLLVIGGCGNDTGETSAEAEPTNPVPTAATLGEQTVLSASEYLAQSPYTEADRRNGGRQAQLCRACHSLEKGGANMIGPNLNGFFGKPIGSSDGFDYSSAALDADFVWTPRALDAWLAQPGRFLPGNKMTFAGVRSASDRADLITFLLEVTDEE